MNRIFHDLKHALRLLARHRLFAVTSVLALGIGIGANTAVFTVVDAVLLHPLPFPTAERLVAIWETRSESGILQNPRNEVAEGNFFDWRSTNRSFEAVTAFSHIRLNVSGVDQVKTVAGELVSWQFFQTLGIALPRGREFRAEDEQPSAHQVAIISDRLWKGTLNSDPAIVGKTIRLSERQYTVVGVAPSGFALQFPITRDIDVWLPMQHSAADTNRTEHYLYCVGRLRKGVSLGIAQAEMRLIASQLEKAHPESNEGAGVNLVPLDRAIVGEIRPYLLLVFGGVSVLLLIVCTNVGNLTVAHLSARTQELAIRQALGVTRSRLVAQLLTENAIISAFASGLGLLLAVWAIDVIRVIAPADFPRLTELHLRPVSIAWIVLLFATTVLLFGFVPALRASQGNIISAIQSIGRSITGSRTRLSRGLLVVEVAVTLVLVVAAGAMVRSSLQLKNVNLGFEPREVVTFNVALPRQKYPAPPELNRFYDRFFEQLRAIPNVSFAGGVDPLPMSGSDSSAGVVIEGTRLSTPADRPQAGERLVTPDYFQTMQIPLVRGRQFGKADTLEAPRVVIINEAMERQFFRGANAVGKRIGLDRGDALAWTEIVGVVGNIRHQRVDADVKPEFYTPYGQEPRRFMTVVVKTAAEPAVLARTVRRELGTIDADQPIFDLATMPELISSTLAQRNFISIVLLSFSVMGIILAGVGMYSFVAYSVAQKTREIAVRMALGATRGDVVALILREGIVLAACGVVLGLVLCVPLLRTIEALLFEVHPFDPATLTTAIGAVMIVVTTACWFPARRASQLPVLMALTA